ncbi:MAG: response regulator [Proteobacteria bacterium]|nr:response regulator [Pseudomonadota bacterium]MBU1964317.1 response regulator [Pseudomonadota bacterium]
MNGLMVVDDEEGVRRSLKKVLERDGYRIVLAENGEEALSIIRSDGRDIETVISDYRMPGMDGLETLIEIGRLNTEITRIMLTGYATMASAIEAVNEGIDGFLTKPFENDELRAKVREYNIKKRLKQFVSEQVLIELQRSGAALLPKRVNVSVLFTDIRGFTSLSEKLNPTELSDLLNLHYFSPLDDIIFRHNGTLDKHIGDSIMGIFGAPVGGVDDAGRAVQAALAIREEIAGINEKISDAERRISIGIGIATGDVMAGIFGSSRKREYTVLGATVNLASRLENLARANQILICGETARIVDNLVNLEKAPSPVIRGLAKPPEVYSVLGRK